MAKRNKINIFDNLKSILLITLFVVIFTGAGCFILHKTYKDQKMTMNYEITVGIVVDYRKDYEPSTNDREHGSPYLDEDYIYAPIIEYEINDKVYTYESQEYSRNPKMIGSLVEMAYDPENPNVVIMDRTKGNIAGYIIGTILTLTGPAIIIFGIITSTKTKKKEI